MRLRYTAPALADLAAILDYIAVLSPQGARRVQARIQASYRVAFAASARRSPHERSVDPSFDDHAVPVPRFLEIAETEIIIHAMRHAARDPSGMPGSA